MRGISALIDKPGAGATYHARSAQAAESAGNGTLRDRSLLRAMPDNVNMQNWPDRRLLELLKIETPIVQAPMAGLDSVALARTVSSTGALGSLACALLSPDAIREAMRALRQEMERSFNLNFSAM